MGKHCGYIFLDRGIQEHWLWKDKPFSLGQAWIDLLMLANYEDKKMPYKGEVITCKRGDVNLSITTLADRWGWSRKKTAKYLETLKSDGMVTLKVSTHRTTVTIVNYAKFQLSGKTKVSTEEQQGLQQGHSKGSITNKYINTFNNAYEESAGAPPIKQMDGFTHVKRVRGGDWYINDANGDKHYEPW